MKIDKFFEILKIVPSILSLLAFFYVGFNVNQSGYDFLNLLPLCYFFFYSFVLKKNLYVTSTIFYKVFNVVVFFRFVVLPFYLVYAQYYGGRSPQMPSNFSFDYAHVLMIYELIVTTIVASYFEKKNIKSEEPNLSIELSFKKNIVFFFFIMAVSLFLIVNKSWLLVVNFFVANPLEIDVSGDILIEAFLFIIVKQIVVVYLISFLAIKYKKSKNFIFLILTFLILAINIGVFIGTNRSDVLVPAIISLLLISKLFSKKVVKGVVVFAVIGVFLMISQITETRNFSSISNGKNEQVDQADFLQVYLGGPYNVALAVETDEKFPEASNIEVLFFDIFRPMIGINFLVKDLDINYSNIYFNRRLFKSDSRSQIMPMIGQGNLFFGPVFAPLFSVFFVFLAYKFNDFVKKSSNTLVYYFFTLSIARMGFLMGQNSMNMINDLSFNIFLFMIVFFINKKITEKYA